MLASKYRYHYYIKRAILQAHITALDETICQIENHDEVIVSNEDDYRIDEDIQFAKYLKMAEALE
jgi:hypothetical protein